MLPALARIAAKQWASSVCRFPAPSRGLSNRWHRPRCASVQSDGPSTRSSANDVPWRFGFQLNERYLQWDDAAAVQLIKIYVANKLNTTVDDVEEKLVELATLVPDLVGKLERTRADILLSLLQDLPALAMKLIAFKELLPGINVSALVSRWPYLALDFDEASLEARLNVMRSQLPGVRLERLIDDEPMLLKADLPTVLANIRRILPKADPVHILVTQPQMVLDMQQAGLSSAIDVEGYPPPN